MNKDNELTSEADWDRNWENFIPSCINPNDQILGEKGSFLKTLESNFSLKQGSSVLELGGACSAY